MSRSFDYLKTATAMSQQRVGSINYDRLAKAGLPGEIVLTNIMQRLIAEAEGVGKEYRPRLKPGNGRDVKFGLDGIISYHHGGLMVAENITLSASTARPRLTIPAPRGVVGASVSYTLANESSEAWSMTDTTKRETDEPTAWIHSDFSGPVGAVGRRIGVDLQRALTDPEAFTADLTRKYINYHGMRDLEYLGIDQIPDLVVKQAQAA